MLKLHVVVTSTRPTRVGLSVGQWFLEHAKSDAHFDATLIDLKAVNLPPLDEPKHPRLAEYEHAHTKAWSATVREADAFVFVTPEYNYGSPPALINALNFLFQEWNYKPAAFVSYGGISGGTRSVQMTKQVLTTLKMMPIPEAVSIPFVATQMKDGRFEAKPEQTKSATGLLSELGRWADAMKTLRG